MLELDWYKCYGESWAGEIIPEAFSHPAKFSRALINRIYKHCIERGWLKEGSMVVDPFGGVGLGGYHALQNGMHWLGVELEPKFVRLGSGYDCPGFSQADWMVRQQMNEEDQKNFGTHLCSTCQKTIAGEKVMGLLLEQAPHRFEGNIDLWNRRYGEHFRKWGTARLVQGDSRKLREVAISQVEQIKQIPQTRHSEQAARPQSSHDDGCHVSSSGAISSISRMEQPQTSQDSIRDDSNTDTSLCQDSFAAVISSPPWGESLATNVHTIRDIPGIDKHSHRKQGQVFPSEVKQEYGQSLGQLAQMTPGDVDAVVTSSPYLGTAASDDPDKRGGLYRDPKRRGDRNLTAVYGKSKGQLGGMVEGVVGSPPFMENNVNIGAVGNTPAMRQQIHDSTKRGKSYGQSPGQLGHTDKDTFWSAACTIVQECYAILKPDGVAIFVVRAFVRKGKIVDFPGQWQRLCESVGFEMIEFIRAWLIEDRANAVALFDFEAEVAGEKTAVRAGDRLRASRKELKPAQVETKSFFRILTERKGSPRIDFEVVLIMRKPATANASS